MTFLFNKRQKSLSEIEESSDKLNAEDEQLGTQLSIAQKRAAIAKLKERGLTPKHFNFDYKKIIQWIRTH